MDSNRAVIAGTKLGTNGPKCAITSIVHAALQSSQPCFHLSNMNLAGVAVEGDTAGTCVGTVPGTTPLHQIELAHTRHDDMLVHGIHQRDRTIAPFGIWNSMICPGQMHCALENKAPRSVPLRVCIGRDEILAHPIFCVRSCTRFLPIPTKLTFRSLHPDSHICI